MPVLRCLVTGATSGLGREFVRQLASAGNRVAFTGRRAAKLDETRDLVLAQTPSAELLPLEGSVTEPATVSAHYAAIRERWGGLDLALLNAGVGDTTPLGEFSTDQIRWLYETNVFGVCQWIETVLPDMRTQRSGTIAAMSSLAGVRGLPTSAGYSSSKAALTTLLESLRVDLVSAGIRVITVAPGYIKSEITARNDPKQMQFLLDTEVGVRNILRGILRGRRYVSTPWQMSFLCRCVLAPMPIWLYDRIASKITRRKKKYIDESKLA